MTARRKAVLPSRRTSAPHRVVNPRNIPEFATYPDGTIVTDGHGKQIRTPVVTIHDVHYYEGDVITEIDDSAQVLIDRGFLVPMGGKTEVENDGEE